MARSSEPPPSAVEVEARLVRVERRRLSERVSWVALGLAMAPLVYGLLVAATVGWSRPPWFFAFAFSSWGLALTTAILSTTRRLRYRTHLECAVRVQDGQVALRPQGTEAWSPLASRVAWVKRPPDRRMLLHLEDGREVMVYVRSAEKVKSFLAAAETGRRRLVTRMRTNGRGARWAMAVIALYISLSLFTEKLSMMSSLQAVFALGFCTGVLGLVTRYAMPLEVTVGEDGVVVQRDRHRLFIPLPSIASVSLDDRTMTIAFEDGGEERIRVSAKNRAELKAVYRRIEAEREAYAASPKAPPRIALLDRDGRGLAEWREAIARQMLGTDFRRSSLSIDDIEAILAAPTTSPEHRVGAALALRIADEDAARDRIRVAAEGTANDELRETLLDVAATEDAERGRRVGWG